MSVADLPFIDEHAVEVAATPERTWDAVRAVMATFRGRGTELFARLLGTSETRARGDPGEAGSTIAGFVVASAEAPTELCLLRTMPSRAERSPT